MESIVVSRSEQETERIAASFARSLQPGDVVALFGGFGMGKTAFTRGLAQGLHASDDVSSPTFALVHAYEADIPIYHFDMYRVHTADDLYSTGFFDYLESGGILVIEWSENIEPFLPDDAKRITIRRGESENERQLVMHHADIGH